MQLKFGGAESRHESRLKFFAVKRVQEQKRSGVERLKELNL